MFADQAFERAHLPPRLLAGTLSGTESVFEVGDLFGAAPALDRREFGPRGFQPGLGLIETCTGGRVVDCREPAAFLDKVALLTPTVTTCPVAAENTS